MQTLTRDTRDENFQGLLRGILHLAAAFVSETLHTGSGNNVIAQPVMLLDIGESDGPELFAIHRPLVLGEQPRLVDIQAVQFFGTYEAVAASDEDCPALTDLEMLGPGTKAD